MKKLKVELGVTITAIILKLLIYILIITSIAVTFKYAFEIFADRTSDLKEKYPNLTKEEEEKIKFAGNFLVDMWGAIFFFIFIYIILKITITVFVFQREYKPQNVWMIVSYLLIFSGFITLITVLVRLIQDIKKQKHSFADPTISSW
ncbi:hypothetical protein [Mycoplasmopsis alligatoris]|uniref:Uncharacterized protein n=1 Tax=Mycoplasmopsis alligatoris A21JP2 TaxID=747682 RepID=D4XWC9_9BACT|nr:hypothetical protein [Mycoplasmopsis alligatoris]EFF41111.1 hypothetical protein MALL_0501 [Mycoplasmopsis alligatoris A21JP2]